MVIFEINIPKTQAPDAFVAFMKDSYFPAVHKGPTRMGQVESLSLGQGRNEHAGDHNERSFLLSVGWNGIPLEQLPRVDGDDVVTRFEAFKPKIKRLGEFSDVAGWARAS